MEIYERDVMQTDHIDHGTPANTQTSLKQDHDHSDEASTTGTKRKVQYVTETDESIYGASRFGHFGEYMRRKRAKLQIQNANIDSGAGGERKTDILKGISVYVRLRILLLCACTNENLLNKTNVFR